MTRLGSFAESTREEWIWLDDPRTLAVDLARPNNVDQMQIEASHVVTSCIRCNTSLQFLGTEEEARSAGFYAVKYCGKNPVKANIILPVLLEMNKQRESTAEDAGTTARDTQYFLTRALNNFCSMCEYSDTQIASSLMGNDSFHASHIFWTFHAKSFVKHQRDVFGDGETQCVAPEILEDDMHHFLSEDDVMDDDDRDVCATVFVSGVEATMRVYELLRPGVRYPRSHEGRCQDRNQQAPGRGRTRRLASDTRYSDPFFAVKWPSRVGVEIPFSDPMSRELICTQ